MLYNNTKFIFLVIKLLIFTITFVSNMELKTANGQKSATKNEDAQFTNTLTNYPSPHPDRNVTTAYGLHMELAQITTTCATRATVNLTYSWNNFLVSYQSVLDKFFRTNTPLVTLSTLTLTELEIRVDVMLANCNTIECYNKFGLFNTQINQLFIDNAEDLLIIIGQQILLDKFAAA